MSGLYLHCLPKSHKKDAFLIWVNERQSQEWNRNILVSTSRNEIYDIVIAPLFISIQIRKSLESSYHLAVVSGAHFTQGTILILILVSSGSAKSRTHQFAAGGFLVNSKGWSGRLRACRIRTFINSVWLNTSLWQGRLRWKHSPVFLIGFVMLSPRILKI